MEYCASIAHEFKSESRPTEFIFEDRNSEEGLIPDHKVVDADVFSYEADGAT